MNIVLGLLGFLKDPRVIIVALALGAAYFIDLNGYNRGAADKSLEVAQVENQQLVDTIKKDRQAITEYANKVNNAVKLMDEFYQKRIADAEVSRQALADTDANVRRIADEIDKTNTVVCDGDTLGDDYYRLSVEGLNIIKPPGSWATSAASM